VFLNMMVGTILEVMTEEHNARSQSAAHDERQQMADQLTRLQAKLDALQHRLGDREQGGQGGQG
jgi:voltage-gated sodium channel